MKTIACWAVFAAYSISAVVVGLWLKRVFARKGKDYKNLEYWMGGREIPGWRLGMSQTSGWLMLGWIGFGMSQIYAYGATGLWLLQIPWFILCVLVVLFVQYYRKVAALSLPQALGRRFGSHLRCLAAFLSVFIFLSWAGAELVMVKTLAAPYVGMEAHPNLFLFIFVLPIIAYAVSGGFRAIVVTDIIQFMFMAVFMAVLGIWAFSEASKACPDGILNALASITPPRAEKGAALSLGYLGWIFPLCMLVGYLPGWLVEQDLALRMQAAPTTKEARKGALVGFVLISTFVIAIPALVAFCALAVFPPGTPKAGAVGEDFTKIILAFTRQMPVWLDILMFLGVIACQMSVVDTFTNVSAIPLAYDLVGPLAMKDASKARVGVMSKRVTAGVILCALLYATLADKLGDVYYISSGVLSASVAIPALAIFWRKASSAAVFAGSLLGALATLLSYRWEYYVLQGADPNAARYYLNELPSWMAGGYGYFYICFGVIVSASSIIVLSLLAKLPRPERLAAVDAIPREGPSPIEAVSE